MKVLGINISHDPSVALVQDGKVVSYYDEGRMRKKKHYFFDSYLTDEYLFQSIKKNIDISDIDRIVVASFDRRNCHDEKASDSEVIDRLKKNLGRDDITYNINHHLYHAICGFYFSNFEKAICIVMDGGGAQILEEYPKYHEIETTYHIEKYKYELKFAHLSGLRFHNTKIQDLTFIKDKAKYKLSHKNSSAHSFAQLSKTLGFFGGFDAGKVMGLAAYGNPLQFDPPGLAAQLQEKTLEDTLAFLQKNLDPSYSKNVVLSGGYALNCTNNYKYTQAFPEYNFFVDPCAHDGGTAIGAALWGFYDNK